MGFDPYNCSLKIWESTMTPIPKVRAHLGVWGFIPSHSLALLGAWNEILGLHIWLAPSQAHALVASSRLRLQQKPCWLKQKLFWITAFPKTKHLTPWPNASNARRRRLLLAPLFKMKVDKEDDKEMGKGWLGYYFHT
jgi:hypothetical protein